MYNIFYTISFVPNAFVLTKNNCYLYIINDFWDTLESYLEFNNLMNLFRLRT